MKIKLLLLLCLFVNPLFTNGLVDFLEKMREEQNRSPSLPVNSRIGILIEKDDVDGLIKLLKDENISDVNYRINGAPLLYSATGVSGAYNVAQYLLLNGADPNLRTLKSEERPFFGAARTNNFCMAELLLENGAELDEDVRKLSTNKMNEFFNKYLNEKKQDKNYAQKLGRLCKRF